MPDQNDVKSTSLIPSWEQSDFLETSAPYEWLYQLKDDPLKMQQMAVVVANAAKTVGVRNFGALWKEYVKSIRKGRGENVTEFTDQPLVLNCGDYVCSDSGISGWGAMGFPVIPCTHPIMPVRRLINIDTGEVKLEIAFSHGKGWTYAVFDKQILSSAQRILALASCGISVTSESAKNLVTYIASMESMNYHELPEIHSVSRLGWMDGYGFSPYVENLLYDGTEANRHIFDCVKQHGSYDAWKTAVKELRTGGSVAARVLLAASFASAIVKPLNALPFIVHAWGSIAGLGKTVGLYLAASVWASPVVGEYCQSFNGTPVGQEYLATFCGNLPLCLDELQCIKGKSRSNFDAMIYMLCEGVGRTRGSRSGGIQRTNTWRNCTLSTGEMPITSGNSAAGAVNRVIELNCNDVPLFDNARKAVSIFATNYGHAGKEFVEKLSSPEALEIMQDIHQAYLDQIVGKATDKQALSAAIILTADALAEMFIFEDNNNLRTEDILPYLITNAMADTNRRTYDWLMDTVASNPNRFGATGYDETYQGECWGKIETDGYVYIIKSHFDRLLSDEGYSSESFLSWAIRKKLIQHAEGRNTTVKWLPKIKLARRCVAIKTPAADGLYEGQETQVELPSELMSDADDSNVPDAPVEFDPKELEQHDKAEQAEKTIEDLPF